jgi:hypothetical protein
LKRFTLDRQLDAASRPVWASCLDAEPPTGQGEPENAVLVRAKGNLGRRRRSPPDEGKSVRHGRGIFPDDVTRAQVRPGRRRQLTLSWSIHASI